MKLNLFVAPVILLVGVTVASVAWAQAPAGSTGECKDGSYTSVEKKRGACAGHGGVKDWYASKKNSEAKADKAEAKSKSKGEKMAPAAAAAPAAAGAAMATPAATKTSTSATAKGMRAEAAPGGGAGKVWVNTSSHVYHCQSDEWYGKTKQGEYMSEAEAKSKGAHASHGKACS